MIISARWVTARVEHPCNGHDCSYVGCKGRIEPGQRYVRLFGAAHEGDPPWVMRLSPPCNDFSESGEKSTALQRSGTTRFEPTDPPRATGGRVSDFPYVWHWKKRLGDRKGQRCRVLARALPSAGYGRTTVLLEFTDGFRVTTSGMGLRRAES